MTVHADYGPYKVHPLANALPLIEGEEFDQLVADVRAHGLTHPITLSSDESTILDGRNRYRACTAALVDPSFTTVPAAWDENAVAYFIIGANVLRRHLTPGQRAFAALVAEEYFAELAKRRQAQAPGQPRGVKQSSVPADLRSADRRQRESSEQAAKLTGASGRGVQQAKAVSKSPDLAEQVKAGKLSLDNAHTQHQQREKAAPKPAPVKPSATMLTLGTSDGTAVEYPQPKAKAKFNRTEGEGISWASWSWNPVTGCLHGCNYCYARETATSKRSRDAYPVGFTPLFHHERLDAPKNTPVPAGASESDRRVFVCSMADLYGRWVPDEWISRVHQACIANPQGDYLMLTKFPARYLNLDLPPTAWLGTSVDKQDRVRIAETAFRQIDGVAVKWLSLEPLLAPLEFSDLSMFDWIVIGSQTQTVQPTGVVPASAPPFEWVARLWAQAREAGCRVHMKPNLGRSSPGMALPDEYPVPRRSSGVKP